MPLKRIAMWSGPRNISTALMRSWENRPDTAVIDEPFYAYYLSRSPYRDEHPGAAEIIAAYATDWHKVAQHLTDGPLPQGVTVQYQKHMTHHILDEMSLDWLGGLRHAFLIRDPRQVVISFAKVIPNPQLDQLGLPQQARLFQAVRQQTGRTPPVVDSKDILLNPRRTLGLLCAALEVPFEESMLSWPAGPRPSDGLWAKYWYASVEQSTGFMPYQDSPEAPPAHLAGLVEQCQALYDQLSPYCLR
jgi:hypothetical protein